MTETINRGIIVLGGHIQGLGMIRILGREGIPGIVIDHNRKNIARHSKYCKGFHWVKEENLLHFLLGLGEKNEHHQWILFPTNDFHVKLLSINKPELQKFFVISTDNWEVINIFYNKQNSYKLAEKLQIPIPKTWYPSSENQLSEITTDFPCIIKPAVMHDFYKKVKKKVFICHNFDDLIENYHRALTVIPYEEIIIQEIIPGDSSNQFSACFLYLNNEIYVSLTACRMRQHPIDFGNATTYAETIDIPIIKEYGEKILKAANYNGLCEVEFKFDQRDKKYKFLEVNTRTWKWHSIANKAQTPFLKLYVNYLNGHKISPVKGNEKASFFHLITDIPVQLVLLFKGFKYWNRIKKPVEPAVWAKDDVKPWLYEKLYLIDFIKKR